MRLLRNVQFWPRSRKAKISTAGIYVIFRGLKFEPDKEIGQKEIFFKGLSITPLFIHHIDQGLTGPIPSQVFQEYLQDPFEIERG